MSNQEQRMYILEAWNIIIAMLRDMAPPGLNLSKTLETQLKQTFYLGASFMFSKLTEISKSNMSIEEKEKMLRELRDELLVNRKQIEEFLKDAISY